MAGAPIGGTPPGAALDQFLRNSYEVVQAVHANLEAITAVASHLTPVEDLVEFQAEVGALYAQLNLLVAASEIIVQVTDPGFDLITAPDVPAQRALLGLGTAALKDVEFFASKTEFDALSAQVTTLSATVQEILVTLATKVSFDELTAILAPILARLDTIDGEIGTLQEGTTNITQYLEEGTYWADLKSLTTTLASQINDPVTGLAAQATAQQQLSTRVTETEGGITAVSEQVIALNTKVSDLETGLSAETSARQALTTRTETLEGVTTAQGEALTQLEASINDNASQLDLQGVAINDLTVRVTSTEVEQAIAAQERTQLEGRITDAETGLVTQGSAIDTLSLELQQTNDAITIAGERTTDLEASITGSGNQLPNAGFEVDLHGWTLFSRGTGWLSGTLVRDLEAETLPPGMHALGLTVTGVPSGEAGIRSDRIPIEANQNYILSGWLAAENCTTRLEWRLYDGLGEQIGFGLVAEVTDDVPDIQLNTWERKYGLIPASADAVQLEVQLWTQDCHTDLPKAWLLRPMLEQAVGSQSKPSPWVAGVVGMETILAGATQALTVRLDVAEGQIETATEAVTDLQSRVGTFSEWRAVSHMTSGTYDTVGAPMPPGLYRAGSETATHTFTRGLTLLRFALTGELDSATVFDTYSNATERDNLRAALNALGPSDAFVLVARDNHGIKQADLTAALENCGALTFADVLGGRPYLLVGRGDLGKGGGIEVYPLSEQLWVDYNFTLINDQPKGLGEQPGVPTLLAGQATALFDLNTRVTATETDIEAMSTAQLALDSRITNAEAALTNEMITSANQHAVVVSSINTLTAQLDDLENQVSANTSAISSLDTRVDSAEGTITAQGSALTALQAQVNAMDTDTGGYGAAISALDIRVTQNEADIESQADAITALQSSVVTANQVFAQPTAPSTSGRRDGDLWFDTDDGNRPYVFSGGTWVLRQDMTKNTIFVQPDQPTAYNLNDIWVETDNNNKLWRWNGTTWVDASDARIAANASAITTLQTRATAIEGVNTSQASAITALETSVNNPVTGLSGLATSIGQLDTRVSDAEDQIDAQSSAITSLNATVAGKASASALTALTSRVTATETSISSINSSITSLNSTVAGKASTTALNSLEARVTTVEGTTTSQSTQLTSLQAQLNGGSDFVYTRTFEGGTRGTWGAGGTVVNATGHASLLKALQFTANLEEDGAGYRTVKPGDIVDFAWDVNSGAKTSGGSVNPTLRCKNKSGANIDVLFTGAGAIGGVNGWQYGLTGTATVPAGAVQARVLLQFLTAGGSVMFTNVRSTVRTLSDNITASAMSSLDARVTGAENTLLSQATALTAVTATANSASANITQLFQVAASAAAANSLQNPSFEYDLDGWDSNGNAFGVTNATNARSGSKFIYLKGLTSNSGRLEHHALIPVMGGQSIRLTMYGGSYGTAPNTGSSVRLNLLYYKADGVTTAGAATGAVLTAPIARYAKATATVVAPADAALIKAVLLTTSTSGNWAVDDVSLELLTEGAANAYATAGITTDVNGYVTGYKMTNDGSTGIFAIVADKFQIVSPGGGARTEYSNGNWRVYDSAGTLRVALGVNI